MQIKSTSVCLGVRSRGRDWRLEVDANLIDRTLETMEQIASTLTKVEPNQAKKFSMDALDTILDIAYDNGRELVNEFRTTFEYPAMLMELTFGFNEVTVSAMPTLTKDAESGIVRITAYSTYVKR